MVFEFDILKSQANLHIQKFGENEINIVGIENSEQHDFEVNIQLRSIDQCDHLDEKIEMTYMLFDKHKLELNQNADDGQFHIDHNINIKLKSSLSDLVTYFRNIFSLPIILISHKNNLKGMCLVITNHYIMNNKILMRVEKRIFCLIQWLLVIFWNRTVDLTL